MNQPGRRPLNGRPFWTSPERPDGQSAPACQSQYILECFWRAVQSQFCFQCEVSWCSVQPVYIFADSYVQNWYKYNWRNSKSQITASKAAVMVLFNQNVKLFPLHFILWFSFAFVQAPQTNSCILVSQVVPCFFIWCISVFLRLHNLHYFFINLQAWFYIMQWCVVGNVLYNFTKHF